MGTWGTAISSNDTYADIYRAFYDLYNAGLEVKEISAKLKADHKDIINDPDDSNNFWFALARAQWECKQLDNEIFELIKGIIESGSDLAVWQNLNGEDTDLRKRKQALDKFLIFLQTERPKAKSRKKKIIRQPVFEKGDCLTFRLGNGHYGGAVVLEAIMDTEYGNNLIALTRINQVNKPNRLDFENAKVLIINYAAWDNKPCINWYNPIHHKKASYLIEIVDRIKVQNNFDINEAKFGFVGDFVVWFIKVADQQFESEKTKSPSTKNLTISELVKKRFWKI
jgi:hypothetical protein